MEIQVVNHSLNLSYEQFYSMGEDISYTTVGKYAIYDEIGRGGFGSVYKAVNQQTKEDIAIKLVDLEKINQQSSERLRQIKLRLAKNEDLMMRICNSPNLIKCNDVYENKGLKLIMMEYCNGGDLQQYIDRKGRIPEKEAILIFKQILNGIAELHSHMIIHRDLKSENILIHNGIFKIADFGFSKQLEVENPNKGGTTLGTITNMAPEIMKRQSYGLKADIWSAGVILFQMVFGDFPFESRQKTTLLTEITGSNIYKQSRITFNGYTATAQMSSLLKATICIDKDRRIGWRDLLTHSIFKQKQMSKVPRSQVVNLPLIAPAHLQVGDENQQAIKGNISVMLKNLHIITKDSVKVMKKMNLQQKKKKEESNNNQEFEINESLTQCLKIELIYEQIISKIKDDKMLDMQQREAIELMYLLINRCFLSLSPINHYMSKKCNQNAFIKQAYEIIHKLYEKVHGLFKYFDQKLREQQDKFGNKVKDFFKSKKQLEQVDKYLNGIQNHDFKKEEQLNFIQVDYINKLKSNLKGPADKVNQLKKYLNIYTKINMILSKNIEKSSFDDYIEELLKYSS